MSDNSRWAELSRRGMLGASASVAALPLAMQGATAAETPKSADPRTPIPVSLTVNGQNYDLTIDSRTTLLDAVRNHLGMTGSKKGCGHGQCGACTMRIGGQPVLSCLTLAAMVRGPVVTIEGVADKNGALHPMQQAFINQDALQCGYCTPGQIMSSIACVEGGHAGSDDSIRQYMSGNLCRCAAYPHILAAIHQAKNAMGKA